MLRLRNTNDTASTPFQYAPGVRFWLRPLTSTALENIKKGFVTIEMRPDPKTRQMVPVEKVDDEKYNDAIIDYLIERWEGVGDAEGADLPVTLENKKLVMDKPALRDFIWAAAQALDVTEVEAGN